MENLERQKDVKIVFDVLVSDPLKVDLAVYSLWVQGLSVADVAKKRATSSAKQLSDDQLALLFRDTQDHFRNYHLLKHYLEIPRSLKTQLVFQIDLTMQQELVARFYEFDEPVIRELLGKKLKNSVRKDLDEEADKLKVPIASCRRQFDNLRRVMKAVGNSEGNLVDLISSSFLLQRDVALKYSRIVFLCYHRLETEKKGLNKLDFSSLIGISALMMDHWTVKSSHASTTDTANNSVNMSVNNSISAANASVNTSVLLESSVVSSSTAPTAASSTLMSSSGSSSTAPPTPLPLSSISPAVFTQHAGLFPDKQLVDALRDIKAILTSEKAQLEKLRTHFVADLQLEKDKMRGVESRFASFLKALLAAGASLSHQREFREFLSTLSEHVGEQLEKMDLLPKDVEDVFRALQSAFDTCAPAMSTSTRHQQRYSRTWHRFLNVVRPCILLMYSRKILKASS